MSESTPKTSALAMLLKQSFKGYRVGDRQIVSFRIHGNLSSQDGKAGLASVK